MIFMHDSSDSSHQLTFLLLKIIVIACFEPKERKKEKEGKMV